MLLTNISCEQFVKEVVDCSVGSVARWSVKRHTANLHCCPTAASLFDVILRMDSTLSAWGILCFIHPRLGVA